MPYDTMEVPPPLELLEVAVDTSTDAPAPSTRPLQPRARAALVGGILIAVVVTAIWATREPHGAAAPPTDRLAPPHGLEGFAEMFVSTYLTAAGDDGVTELRQFYAAGPVAAELNGNDRWVTRTAAVAVERRSPQQWQVTVAADVLTFDGTGYRRNGVQHYLVGVVEGASGLAATSLPVRTPAPPPAPIPVVAGGTAIDDPAVAALVGGFLDAYLTGMGDLRAYASADLGDGVPDGFASVSVTDITGMPDPGGVLQLRVRGTATERSGETIPVEYYLAVAADGATMRIAEVAATPLPADPTD